jgi:hypothetical protein
MKINTIPLSAKTRFRPQAKVLYAKQLIDACMDNEAHTESDTEFVNEVKVLRILYPLLYCVKLCLTPWVNS